MSRVPRRTAKRIDDAIAEAWRRYFKRHDPTPYVEQGVVVDVTPTYVERPGLFLWSDPETTRIIGSSE